MSSSSSKWLIGCTIGCAALIVLGVVLGTSGYLFIKGRMRSLEEANTAVSELEKRYGKIRDFSPDPGGAIRPERIKAFLSVRDATAAVRQKLETSFASMSEGMHEAKSGEKPFWSVMRILGKGFGIIPEIGEFHSARARAMLDAGIGMGEYCYIYVVAYYAWLGKSPEDGPDFRLEGGESESIRDQEGEDVRALRRVRMVRQIRQMFLAMLRNQLSQGSEGGSTDVQDSRRKILEAEVAALEKHPDRLPWQDGLPKQIDASLQPFRQQLEASYSAVTNALELGFDSRWRSGTRINNRLPSRR